MKPDIQLEVKTDGLQSLVDRLEKVDYDPFANSELRAKIQESIEAFENLTKILAPVVEQAAQSINGLAERLVTCGDKIDWVKLAGLLNDYDLEIEKRRLRHKAKYNRMMERKRR